jgi:multidrug efflux pump
MARFFLHHPVFAWVLAIVTMLIGAFGLRSLPVTQYPDIAPTSVQISATYSGASAEAVDTSVTEVIANSMTELDGLLYISSDSSNGSAKITLTFGESVDPNIAQVQVQNKLQLVEAILPADVLRSGITVTHSSSTLLLVGTLVSESGTYNSLELGNILSTTILKPLQRIGGVGAVESFGSEFAMRIWLDPYKLYQYQISPTDVTEAIAVQNTSVSVGSLGAQPAVQGQQITLALTAQSQLSTVQDFEHILLRANADGSAVYLADVARVELAAETPGLYSRLNGNPAAGFGVNLATGANAVETAQRVRSELTRLERALPSGVSVEIPYDSSVFVEKSITEIYRTVAIAIALVSLVTLLFLQNLRATLIPAIAIPVVMLGTFGVLAMAGLSINTLTLFAMVLAIGLLVDDAIVVVESVERVMDEEGLSVFEATQQSMTRISSALVGIVMVLSAVFLPMAFMSGATGVIYKQFSFTIIAAMVISLFVALILTPTMCVQLLKPKPKDKQAGIFVKAQAAEKRLTQAFSGLVAILAKRPGWSLVFAGLLAYASFQVFERLPSSFIPKEDQSQIMAFVNLPDGTTVARTDQAVKAVENYLATNEADVIEAVFASIGSNYSGGGQNSAILFINLKSISDRQGLSANALSERLNLAFSKSPLARFYFMEPPSIHGLGSTSGFSMYLLDEANAGSTALQSAVEALASTANSDSRLVGVRTRHQSGQTKLQLNIDQQKVKAYQLSLANVNTMLSTVFAGHYVNDFRLGDDLRSVIVQGDAPYRMQPSDIDSWYFPNSLDEMVPVSAFISKDWTANPSSVVRYNGVLARSVSGAASPGTSSGAAMDAMAQLVSQLDGGYGLAWTGASYQERLATGQQTMLFTLSALIVFLSLAALYESWTVPLAVMLAAPVGILGALLSTWGLGLSNDVYLKVGLLAIVGLASRNAVLIVGFAERQRATGVDAVAAALEATRQRLRPILMTSFAFGFGVAPLAFAAGVGAEAQKSIGTGMLGGIVFSTLLGTLLVPILYVAIVKLVGWFLANTRKKTTEE